MTEKELLFLEQRLPGEEQKKTEKKEALARRQSVLGRWLLRYAAAQIAGEPCDVAYELSGKPTVVGGKSMEKQVYVSCTHCMGLIAAVAAPWPVGLDAELCSRWSPRVAEKYFSPQEQREIFLSNRPEEAFSILWTLRESLGKLRGCGVTPVLRHSFSLLPPHTDEEGLFCRTWSSGKWRLSLCSAGEGETKVIPILKQQLFLWVEKQGERQIKTDGEENI